MTRQLQEGIYYERGARPAPAFGIVFLEAGTDVDAEAVGITLLALWEVYAGLKRGMVPDLPGQTVPAGNLTCLLGYGIKAFELAGARRRPPDELSRFGRFRSPLTSGGGSVLLGSGQVYGDDVRKNPATEIVAVQFVADTELAVNRAIVETWKFLHDRASQGRVLNIAAFFRGFQRDDHRSWIDFHDGVSNLRSDERYGVIAVKEDVPQRDAWTIGGTYMAYMRVAVDLQVWRVLNRSRQEALVGRDKLTGCALEVTPNGVAPVARCPVAGTVSISDSGNEMFHEPPDVRSFPIGVSHVQRVNHHITPSEDRNSLRIYRQGYEFLESTEHSPGFRVGLNFVSFQDTPERLFRMLTQDGWLGRTNFGGDPDRPIAGEGRLLETRAAGIFFVPPVVGTEKFPGSSIFVPRSRGR